MFCDQTCVKARATCQNLNGRDVGKNGGRRCAKRVITDSALTDRVAQTIRLLKYLFEHVVFVITQTLIISLQRKPRRYPLDRGTGGIKNSVGSSRQLRRITVLEVNKRVGDGSQCKRVRTRKMLSNADP